MQIILERLLDNETLSYNEAKNVLGFITDNKYNEAQIASFLTIYRKRGITIEELKGFRAALLERCHKINLSEFHPIDLCGTGGDGKNTFNISTASAFVVAGAGIKVAKHGNYGVSSKCGSSNVLEYLGIKFSNDQNFLERCIESAGICILHAPLFHPAMKNVFGIRKNLGIKTLFNILGPLVNPSSPEKQLTGVYSLEVARLYQYLFQEILEHYTIIYDLEAYDEVSLIGSAKLLTERGEFLIDSHAFNVGHVIPLELFGGKTVKDAGLIFLEVLKGKGTRSQENVVCANAGLAISTALSTTFKEGFERAREAIKNKRAFKTFSTLHELCQKWMS